MKQNNQPKRKLNPKVLGRTIKLLFKSYPVLAPVTVFCILFSAAVSAIPAVFQQNVIALIEKWYKTGDWASASGEIFPQVSFECRVFLDLTSFLNYTHYYFLLYLKQIKIQFPNT